MNGLRSLYSWIIKDIRNYSYCDLILLHCRQFSCFYEKDSAVITNTLTVDEGFID